MIQHQSEGVITTALHVHLDAHSCLEVIPLRGSVKRVQQVASRLISVKGVRYGQLVPATTGKHLGLTGRKAVGYGGPPWTPLPVRRSEPRPRSSSTSATAWIICSC